MSRHTQSNNLVNACDGVRNPRKECDSARCVMLRLKILSCVENAQSLYAVAKFSYLNGSHEM